MILASAPAQGLTLARSEDNIAYAAVHNLGYDGSGVIIGVLDLAYARTDHRTFWISDDCHTSRVTKLGYYGGSTTYNGHPNAVAGIAAGRGKGDGTYEGVAPGAQVWSASTSGRETDIRQAFLDFSAPDAQGKKSQTFAMSLAANVVDCGIYPVVMFMDWMATNRGALISFGAGNSNDKIWIPGGNYNQLTVGGLDVTGLHAAPTLSRGPTGDGRSKPDFLAPATGVYLPDHIGVDAWYRNPGSYTSISGPFGAGATALIREYGDTHGWTWDPRVAKAVLLNSATKLKGWTHTDTQPLDFTQGAGRLDAEWAVYNYAAGEQPPGSVARRGWDIGVASNQALKTYDFTLPARPDFIISATLDWWRWTQPLDDNLLGYNWATTKFENLNLYLYRDSDCAVVARSISSIDSVEHLYYRVTQQDTYSLVVELLGSGNRTETYGLAWNTLVPGDANGDGKINGADLAIWQRHYDPLGLTDNIFTWGDWNGDGKIDGSDLAMWQRNYDPLGTGLGQPLTVAQLSAMIDLSSMPEAAAMLGSLAGVPEPGSLMLLALGLAAGAGALRRRRRTP